MRRRSEPLRVAIFLLLACLALPSAAEEAPQPARERRYVFGYLGALDAEADAIGLHCVPGPDQQRADEQHEGRGGGEAPTLCQEERPWQHGDERHRTGEEPY